MEHPQYETAEDHIKIPAEEIQMTIRDIAWAANGRVPSPGNGSQCTVVESAIAENASAWIGLKQHVGKRRTL